MVTPRFERKDHKDLKKKLVFFRKNKERREEELSSSVSESEYNNIISFVISVHNMRMRYEMSLNILKKIKNIFYVTLMIKFE